LESLLFGFLKILKSLGLKNGIVDIKNARGKRPIHHSIFSNSRFHPHQIEAIKNVIYQMIRIVFIPFSKALIKEQKVRNNYSKETCN